jgi:undecaprenyl-diphosphatase
MSIELQILQALAQLRTPYTVEAARALTEIGSFFLIPVYIVTLYIVGKKTSSYMLGLGSFLTGGIVYCLKLLIARPRPPVAVLDVVTPAFPSGHTAAAFLTAVVLGKHFPREKRWFLGLASLVGFTRLFLGVHYLSDVLVGGLIGWGIGELVVKNEEWLMDRARRYVRLTG